MSRASLDGQTPADQPNPGLNDSDEQQHSRFFHYAWRLLDTILFLQMGQAYRSRFRSFARNHNVSGWRRDQQGEWDRLSTSLALLATMNAAILAVSEPPPLAFALWLAGAGLSICGLFIVQYFSIRAFPLTDAELGFIVSEKSIHTGVLGTAIASPVIITLWVAVLFGVGIADFLIEKDLHGHKYTIIAGVPIALGFTFVFGTLYIGGLLTSNLASKTSLNDASDTTPADTTQADTT